MNATSDIFAEIIGAQMGAVTFVQDYLQLHFDGPTINVYIPMEVRVSGQVVRSKEEGFRDALCGQIAKLVASVTHLPEEGLTITFEGGSSVWISLRRCDYEAPEAISTHSFKNGDFWV
jgi:hypothetical protein